MKAVNIILIVSIVTILVGLIVYIYKSSSDSGKSKPKPSSKPSSNPSYSSVKYKLELAKANNSDFVVMYEPGYKGFILWNPNDQEFKDSFSIDNINNWSGYPLNCSSNAGCDDALPATSFDNFNTHLIKKLNSNNNVSIYGFSKDKDMVGVWQLDNQKGTLIFNGDQHSNYFAFPLTNIFGLDYTADNIKKNGKIF